MVEYTIDGWINNLILKYEFKSEIQQIIIINICVFDNILLLVPPNLTVSSV